MHQINQLVGYLPDLWSYDVTAGTWALLKGTPNAETTATYSTQGQLSATNTPGRLQGGVAFYSQREASLFLFGGGYAWAEIPVELILSYIPVDRVIYYTNAMWRFRTDVRQWALVMGAPSTSSPGTPDTIPGARGFAAHAYDVSQEQLYMYGGAGVALNNRQGT